MGTNILDFLSGKIGKFGDSAAQFAKNISVEGMQNGWNTYIKRSPEELAQIARNNMLRKNTVMSNLDISEFNKMYNAADKSNIDFSTELDKFKGALNASNIDEAKSVAETISKRFQDNKYLEYLDDVEKKYNVKNTKIEKYDTDTIHLLATEKTKQKLQKTPIINNFIDDGEWLAEKAYRLDPRGIPAYFTTANKKTNRIRAGVVGAGYAGGTMVVRGLQGGNPVTNEYGERDIAGIPFI